MIIAVVGKGGVGKTTVTSLLLRRLLRAGQTPVLAVDADPSSCLGALLGVSVDPDCTLGEMRDRLRGDDERPASVSKSDWLKIMAEEAIVEQTGFDLLTMGHPEGPGCYCFVNNLLRDYLARLGRAYRHVLVDCEAGQEHLSRRTTGHPDVLVCVINRSRMSALAVRRCLGVYEALHESLPPRVELILNGFEPDEQLGQQLADLAGRGPGAGSGRGPGAGSGRGPGAGRLTPFARITALPTDPGLAEFEAGGRSLLELDPDSAASVALNDWEQEL